jgi:hypothetical protein
MLRQPHFSGYTKICWAEIAAKYIHLFVLFNFLSPVPQNFSDWQTGALAFSGTR